MIMKRFLKYCLLIAAVALVASCRPAPSISVNPSSIDVPSAGGSFDVTVTSNCDWTAAGAESWIKVSQTAGAKGTTTLTVKVSNNNLPDNRTGSVVISSNGEPVATLAVNQSQKDMLVIVDESAATISAEAQTVEIQISTNVDYTATVNPPVDWLKIISTKGLNVGRMTISVEANDSFAAREAIIEFGGGVGELMPLLITQEGHPQVFRVVHTLDTYKAPVVFGFGANGTINWGDGETGTYSSNLVHTYTKPGQHEVVIEIRQASTASVSDFIGLEKVDLSEF